MLTRYETTFLLQALNAETKKDKIKYLQKLLETEDCLFSARYGREPDLTVYAEPRNWARLTIGAMLKLHQGALNENEHEGLCVVLNAWIKQLIEEEAGE